ncbi:MAG: oxaloacetate decarboxylase [Lachnospiraceae bacterium]|nr:oxaloacetate decarboxylase [Lachnospiraceae bacterium]
MKKIVGIALMVIGIVVTALSLILKIKGQISVSVIGGTDGPTSIFLAGKVVDNSAVTGIIAGIVLLVVGIFMIVRKK